MSFVASIAAQTCVLFLEDIAAKVENTWNVCVAMRTQVLIVPAISQRCPTKYFQTKWRAKVEVSVHKPRFFSGRHYALFSALFIILVLRSLISSSLAKVHDSLSMIFRLEIHKYPDNIFCLSLQGELLLKYPFI